MGASATKKQPVAKKSDAQVEQEIAAKMGETPDVDGPADDDATPTKEKKVKEPRFTPLPVERTAWIAANARPAVSSCLCGCNGTTKGRFVPGHDATLKESLKASAAAGDENATAALATFGW